MSIIKRLLTVLFGKDGKAESIEKQEKTLFEKVNVVDEEYREYLNLQLRRTLQKKDTNPFSRAAYFVNQLGEIAKADKDVKILCIGCRDSRELNEFRKSGFNDVIGIDLHSEDPSILIMDMHRMEFEPNSFDILLSSHSLEHSYDVAKVISEFVRVSQKKAIIMLEVPVNYEVRGADRNDFGNLKKLYENFENQVDIKKIYFEEEVKKEESQNYDGTDIIRTIFEIEKRMH